MTNPKSQNDMLHAYLGTHRSLTQSIALNNLGVGSLTSRIAQLRKKMKAAGDTERILDEWKKDFNGKKYKQYHLVERPAKGWGDE